MYESKQTSVSEAEIREELRLLLRSKSFQQSQRLVRFLNFTVERAISGKLEDLKEYTIGVEVYDRGSSFCPSLDSIVRGEARRLRGKLKEYYEGEGRRRPVTIYYRLGSYVPLFRRAEPSSDDLFTATVRRSIQANELKLVVAVAPFRDLSNKPISLALANGITDDLIHLLTKEGSYRVVAASALAQSHSPGTVARTVGMLVRVDILFDGCVKQEGDNFRITSSLVDADGIQLCSHRFEASGTDGIRLLPLQETVASDLVQKLSDLVGSGAACDHQTFSSNTDVHSPELQSSV